MDHFMEEVVVKKHKGVNEFLYILANILMVIMALLGFTMITPLLTSFSIPALVIVLSMIGGAVYIYLFKDRLRLEYEYTFTNGELDFAQVYNNVKRKSLGTMRVNNVEAFGKVDSPSFQKFINMSGVKRRNWFLNREANLYYFFYKKDTTNYVIIFEPSEELVDMISKYVTFNAKHA